MPIRAGDRWVLQDSVPASLSTNAWSDTRAHCGFWYILSQRNPCLIRYKTLYYTYCTHMFLSSHLCINKFVMSDKYKFPGAWIWILSFVCLCLSVVVQPKHHITDFCIQSFRYKYKTLMLSTAGSLCITRISFVSIEILITKELWNVLYKIWQTHKYETYGKNTSVTVQGSMESIMPN